MKSYTVERSVEEGIAISTRQSQRSGNSYLAVEVGEEGRGRQLGWVAMHPIMELGTSPCPRRGEGRLFEKSCALCGVGYDHNPDPESSRAIHPDVGVIENRRLRACSLGRTKSGGYIITPESRPDSRALVSLYFPEGFRGGNSYHLPETGCIVLAEGYHARGDAGRMGGGRALLLVLDPGAVIECSASGRLYGGPSRMKVVWDGTALVAFDPASEPEDCDLAAVEEV